MGLLDTALFLILLVIVFYAGMAYEREHGSLITTLMRDLKDAWEVLTKPSYNRVPFR